MHPLAAGKALLATLPTEELDRYFAEVSLDRFTPMTLASEPKLRKQLADIRETGFSHTDEEYSLGINGLGRAVRIGGDVAGALSIAVPKARYTEALDARAKDLLAKTAALLESS